MPILSFSSNDIDVITGKKRRTIRKLWKTPLKKGDRLYCYWNLVSKEKMKIFEEMTRHSTAKFASNKTDIAKPKQEESVLGQQGSNEEPKEKPVEKRLGIFGTRKVKR